MRLSGNKVRKNKDTGAKKSRRGLHKGGEERQLERWTRVSKAKEKSISRRRE